MKRIWFAMLAVGVLLSNASHSIQTTHSQRNVPPHELQLISVEDLEYPVSARRARVQGVVVVKIELDEEGNVADVFAISGAKDLIPDSLANAKKWKFKPAGRGETIIVY